MFHVWSTLLVPPASLLGQHVVKPKAASSKTFLHLVRLGPGRSLPLPLSQRCQIANSSGALSLFVRIYPRSLRKRMKTDSQAAAQVQREAGNDEERQCRHQSLDRSGHKATLRACCWPFFQSEGKRKAGEPLQRIETSI